MYPCIQGSVIRQEIMADDKWLKQGRQEIHVYKQASDVFSSPPSLPPCENLVRGRASLVTNVKRLIALGRAVPIKRLGY